MALIEKHTPHEFLVRWDDAGNLKGAHIAHRIAYVDDATAAEAFSKFGDPQPVSLDNAALLSEISGSINQAALADNTAKAAQIAQLISERDAAQEAQTAAEAARDEALAELAKLQPLPPVNGVPQEVTRRQARQALILSGKFGLVQPAIDSILDVTQRALMQSEWDDSQTFQRQRPSLIQMAAAIGLTDADLDALFVQAAAL